MKLLMLIHTTGHGGAENVFRWLAHRLQQEGIQVIAGIPIDHDRRNGEQWITSVLKNSGVPIETFDLQGGRHALYRNIFTMIRRVKPLIVHSHLLDSNFYSSLACKALSVPHVCTEHGDISCKRSFTNKLKFIMISLLSNQIVCVSEAVKKQVVRNTILKGRISVIHNGINCRSTEQSSFRSEFNIPYDAFVIGNVGNLYPVKGQVFLISAFGNFLKVLPNSYLVLVGRGNQQKKISLAAARAKIPQNRLILTGFRSDIENIMNCLNLYVQPSLSEGLPVSVLEALSCGLPVIATNVGGVPEILGNDEYGLLIPPARPDVLYSYMATVAENQTLYRKKAALGQVMVREKFSVEAMARQYLLLYRTILMDYQHKKKSSTLESFNQTRQ